MSGDALPIGILLDTLDDEYQVAVLRGALSAARDLGASVLCLPGGRVRDTRLDRSARNLVFELANPRTVSGVLAVSSVIGSAIGPLELAPWLGRFAGLPLCCVGVPVEGHVAVEVDNSGGIRELVLHLVREHQRKHLAFVRGPVASAEADARFAAFKAALEEVGQTLEPSLVAPGDFLKASGVAAVRTLLDERGLAGRIDAIVAANDYMALGVMEELWRKHVDVPGEIAVVGFDDLDSARLARPALTTVSQPIELLGRRGLEAAVELTRGRRVSPSSLSTKLVLRGSCGCPAAGVGLASSVALTVGRGVEVSFVQRRHAILAEMARAAEGRFGAAGSGWEARLLDALIGDLRGFGSSSFYRTFEQLLAKLGRSSVSGIDVQDVLTALRRQSLPCVAGVSGARDHLEDALHEARILASVFSEQACEQRARVMRERQRAFEQQMRSALFSDTARRSEIAAERLPEFGVEACLVASLAEAGNATSEATLVFGFGPSERVLESTPIGLGALPRHAVLENTRRIQVALPLTTSGSMVGVAVVALSKPPDAELEQLREFLSSALDTLRRASPHPSQ